jgi:hypothetical protein
VNLKKSAIPGGSAVNGLCWIAFAVALAPASTYFAFYFWQKLELSRMEFCFTLAAGLLLPAAILLYGISRFARTLKEIMACYGETPKQSVIAWTGAVLFPFAGFFLLPVFISGKRYFSAAAALLSGLCGIFYFVSPSFLTKSIKVVIWFNLFGFYAEIAGICYLLLLALSVGIAKKENRSGTFLFPLIGTVLIPVGLIICNIKTNSDIKKHKARLSEIVGLPVKVETFRKINSEGSWSSGIRSQMMSHSAYVKTDWGEIKSVQQAQKTLKEFEKKNPVFIKYLEQFYNAEWSYFSTEWPGDEFIRKIGFFDAHFFENASRYLLLKIQAFPCDKKLVQKTNQQVLRFEQWLKNSALSLKKFYALRIELERLKTLEKLWVYPEWTTEELLLLGGKNLPDSSGLKKFVFIDVLLWENQVAAMMIGSVCHSWAPGEDSFPKKVATFLKNRFYLYAYTHFKHTVCKSIAYACIFSQLPEFNHDFPAHHLPEYKNKLFGARLVNFISYNTIVPINATLLKTSLLRDYKRMYLAAVNIRDYWLKHGKLPDNPVLFKSEFSGYPLRYDKLEHSFILTVRYKEGDPYSRLFKLPPKAQ